MAIAGSYPGQVVIHSVVKKDVRCCFYHVIMFSGGCRRGRVDWIILELALDNDGLASLDCYTMVGKKRTIVQ